MNIGEHIAVDPQVMLGKPVIRGTRIPVELLLRKLAEGATERTLIEAYPQLKPVQIQAALAYAADALSLEHAEPLAACAVPSNKEVSRSWTKAVWKFHCCNGAERTWVRLRGARRAPMKARLPHKPTRPVFARA